MEDGEEAGGGLLHATIGIIDQGLHRRAEVEGRLGGNHQSPVRAGEETDLR